MRLSSHSPLPFAAVLGLFALAAGCPEDPLPCEQTDAGCPVESPVPKDECDDDAPCDDGFACVDGDCVECPLGTQGCACDGSDTCLGDTLVCGDDGLCEDPGCPAGSEGCPCLPGDECGQTDDGLLMLCDRDAEQCRRVLEPVDNGGTLSLSCYTPCTESFTLADGSFRYCSPEGLMDGCLGTKECVDGSCVGEGEGPLTCASDVDCPIHQGCLSGFCLSSCELDADCGAGAICASKVCRQVCETTGNTDCGHGLTCQSVDGYDGWCMPQVNAQLPASEGGAVPMELSTQSLAFTNNRTSGQVLLTNPGERVASVTLTRLEHTEIDDDGRTKVEENPLQWVYFGVVDGAGLEIVAPTLEQVIELEMLPGETVAIQLTETFNSTLERWEGLFRIESTRLGQTDVFLESSTLPDGQWSGTSYYFVDFPTGALPNDAAVDEWLTAMAGTSRDAKLTAARATGNALLVTWTDFRTNPLFSLAQWDAVVQSTLTSSWSQATVHDACRALFTGNTNAECYLFADPDDDSDPGLRIYTDRADVRVPGGTLEMPFTVRLASSLGASQPFTFTGRVETPAALQYPGLPPATLRFALDPEGCETAAAEACIVPLADFDVTSLVGGRYALGDDSACTATGFEAHEVPWMIPDFLAGTDVNEEGIPVRYDCRESRFPVSPGTDVLAADKNRSLAGANPLPDGRVRRREVDLLDGMMVNQDTLLLLVRERFQANLEPPSGGASADVADFSAYSLIQLARSGADLSLEADPYTPGVLPDELSFSEPEAKIENRCDAVFVDDLIGDVLAGNEATVASKILFGIEDVASPPTPVTDVSDPGLGELHYLCHATGRIDGGPSSFNLLEGCPAGSGVTYFFYFGAADITEHSCQGTASSRCKCVADEDGDCVEVDCSIGSIGTCADLFVDVQYSSDFIVDVPYQCDTLNGTGTGYTGEPAPARIACNDDRFDLRVGKLFYDPTAVQEQVTPPLENLVNEAFRYKTRFQARSGSSLGFVPDVCATDASILPYCYDPAAIEDVRERASCLVDIFASGALDPVSDAAIYEATRDFLEGAFSFYQDEAFGPTRDGFERLYSELLVMLGDEALTSAAASRFDLAGTQVATFRGDWLEPDGMVLSGGPGYEMTLLYRAHQYFQMVLDRFFQMSPSLWQGLQQGEDAWNFITLDSVSTYFNRVILASTKKALASSEIAKRYQSFNRADLARHVIERAYAEAYLESIAIGQLMRNSVAVLDATEVDALQFELLQAQRRYRQALRRMREAYGSITDQVTFFGDPPEYVPFPSAGKFDIPAPRQMIERAQEALVLAKEREDRALTSNRQFDVDAAQFQSELARIQGQYEGELADLCGTFVTDNGRVYPALSKYADLHPLALIFGDPCGLLGTGHISDAMGDAEARSIDLRAEIADIRAVFARVAVEQTRVENECAGRVALADINFKAGSERLNIRETINKAEVKIASWERKLSVLDRTAGVSAAWAQVADSVVQGLQACQTIEAVVVCAAAAKIAVVAGVGHSAAAVTQSVALGYQVAANEDIESKQADINEQEERLEELQRDTEYAVQVGECCLDEGWVSGTACEQPGPLMTNSEAQVDTHLVDLLRTELEASRAELELQRSLGRLASMRNETARLQALQADTEQHLINLEAARNDPNVRIYANADVLDADRSFNFALKAAFRATRMYEYYTATSYAAKEDLFLVRMAGRGENNLEDYIVDLQHAFNDFEQVFGSPSLRVHVLSLMDDIFQVPRVDEEGGALLPAERTALLRERLTHPGLLDDHGYIRVPFSTSVNLTSPLTAIHKVAYVEAEVQGSDLGDRVGRLYLTSKGTATIRDLGGSLLFHRMDPVTAVINPYFNGVRLFEDTVYQEERLRDRPFANTLWELGLNLRDEQVNEDINVSSITDVRLYVFYEDFTQL